MIIGTGVDIIEVQRVKEAIDRWGDGFLSHVFTAKEIAYARQHKFPAQHFAARFAAKEAVYKAIGDDPRVGWKDLEIVNDAHGRPCCVFLKDQFKYQIHVSLSHTRNYAVANAIITQESPCP
ncbi:MAG: holo-ACP synthase [Candidatus Omnitrophica bacterium]|nr:holo-ACP synthase [Candidatus Omnitrophota bacterium]